MLRRWRVWKGAGMAAARCTAPCVPTASAYGSPNVPLPAGLAWRLTCENRV